MKTRGLIGLFILIFLLISCSNKGGGKGQGGEEAQASGHTAVKESVKLLFYVTGPTLTNTEFNTLIAGPVKEKYPHITIERLEPPTGITVQELFSSGPVPDLTLIINPYPLIRMGVVEDLRPWIKKYQFDESRLKPILYDHLKEFGKNGEIVAIPFNANQAILYYNKDIFDKFGIPYPPDKQLAYEDMLDISRQLTRTENGVNYIGFDPNGPTDLMRNLALPIIDPVTGDSLLTTRPEWTKIFQFLKQTYEIPGYIGPNNKYAYGRDAFMKDRTLAMRVANLANMVGPLEELRQQGQEFNWDIAPNPNFRDQLPNAREAQVHSFVISNKSRYKDEAFQVIQHILTDEVQRKLSRNARIPAINNPELEKEFGADIPVLKGKKVHNVFIGEQLKTHKLHEYEDQVSKWVTEAGKDVAVGGVDVNTALRTASEKVNKEVQSLVKNQ